MTASILNFLATVNNELKEGARSRQRVNRYIIRVYSYTVNRTPMGAQSLLTAPTHSFFIFHNKGYCTLRSLYITTVLFDL